MAVVERIGSFERHGEWWRCEVAVDGQPLAPVWLSAPEFQEYERKGDLMQQVGFIALIADEHGRELLPESLSELSQRRFQ